MFANKDRDLASGLFVRVRIPVSKPYQALLIPERALATDQNIKFVYVVGSDGMATRRNVELGAQRGDMRIITAGLKPGEQVIVKGLQRVRAGPEGGSRSGASRSRRRRSRKPVTPTSRPQPTTASAAPRSPSATTQER